MNYDYLQTNEGTRVKLVGTYRAKTPKQPFSTDMLVLDDGTEIILIKTDFEDQAAVLQQSNHGREIEIEGSVFIKDIPAEYNIIARTDKPYLVDIQSAGLVRQ